MWEMNLLIFWSLCRTNQCVKVSTFVWRLLNNRLPTKDNLMARGTVYQVSSLCIGEYGKEEYSSHLFFECPIFGTMQVAYLGGQESKAHFQMLRKLMLENLESQVALMGSIVSSLISFGQHCLSFVESEKSYSFLS